MGLKRLTAPQKAPVVTTELRRWIGWDESDSTHDAELQMLAMDAADMIERYTRRAFMHQTWRWITSIERVYEIPRPPLLSIESFKIYDEDGASTTVSSGDYQLITDRTPGLIIMADSWSRPEARDCEPVEIEFTAGYGDSGDEDEGEASVPREVRTAILQLVTMYFEHRGDTVIGFGTAMDLPLHVKAKINGLTAGTKVGYFSGKV